MKFADSGSSETVRQRRAVCRAVEYLVASGQCADLHSVYGVYWDLQWRRPVHVRCANRGREGYV